MEAIFFNDFQNSYIPHILKEIYVDKIYQPFLIGKRDLTMVDYGGNLGLVSYFFKDYAKKVYCVEPSKQHIECINKMIEFNKIKNIQVCPYAISNSDGKTKFFHNTNSTMFSLLDRVNDKDDYEEVDTFTVESFMKKEKIEHIDLMKMDLEGFESEVVSSDGFKSVCKNIDIIIGEHHAWSMMGPKLFETSLKDLGFTFKWLNKSEASIFSAIRL